jgi:hypothetical protein
MGDMPQNTSPILVPNDNSRFIRKYGISPLQFSSDFIGAFHPESSTHVLSNQLLMAFHQRLLSYVFMTD